MSLSLDGGRFRAVLWWLVSFAGSLALVSQALGGGFAVGPSMTTPRADAASAVLGTGKVLVTGGVAAIAGPDMASAEVFDPGTGTWTPVSSMSVARDEHTSTTLLNGKVLVVGGQQVGVALASAELYDPAANTWSSAAAMQVPRVFHTATLLLDGRVLVVGGQTGSPGKYSALTSAEIYDPSNNSWSSAGFMASPHLVHSATRLKDGSVLVAGGLSNTGYPQTFAGAEVFRVATGTWTAAGGMATQRANHADSLLPNGNVLIVGGYGPPVGGGVSILASADVYDVDLRPGF